MSTQLKSPVRALKEMDEFIIANEFIDDVILFYGKRRWYGKTAKIRRESGWNYINTLNL